MSGPRTFIVVNTDNFGGDYPDESCLGWTYADGRTRRATFDKDEAEAIAKALQDVRGGNTAPRYHCVKPMDYVLQPGFEP